jgi:hypothetical protein
MTATVNEKVRRQTGRAREQTPSGVLDRSALLDLQSRSAPTAGTPGRTVPGEEDPVTDPETDPRTRPETPQPNEPHPGDAEPHEPDHARPEHGDQRRV